MILREILRTFARTFSGSIDGGKGTPACLCVLPHARRQVRGRVLASCVLAWLAGLVATAPARAAEADKVLEDEIVRLTHTPVIGVLITKDNWQVVYGEMQEGGITVPASDVMETVYADAPREFLFGVQRVKRGFYSKAIDESFEPAMKDLKKFREVEGQPWAKQYCLHYLGVCYLKRGKPGDAPKARDYFEQLIKEVPQSRFIFEAYTGIGDSLQVEKKYAAAAEAFVTAQERFEKMAREVKDIETVRAIRKRALEAQFRQGEMFHLAGEYDKAVSIFNSVAANARDYPDLRYRATSAAVRSLVAAGAYRLAIDKATELIKQGERDGCTEYLGVAYMGLADCYFEEYANAEKEGRAADPQGLVVARYNYIRVATLHFEDESIQPKAHFRSGRCYERLAQAGEGAKALERAKRHYTKVLSFGESDWAKEAKSRLTALGK